MEKNKCINAFVLIKESKTRQIVRRTKSLAYEAPCACESSLHIYIVHTFLRTDRRELVPEMHGHPVQKLDCLSIRIYKCSTRFR